MKSWFAYLLIAFLFIQCKRESPVNRDKPLEPRMPTVALDSLETNAVLKDSLPIQKDTLIVTPKEKAIEKPVKKPKVAIYEGEKYSIWPHKGNDSLIKKFNKEFTAAQKYTIAALNRIDVDHIKTRDSLIVPNEFYSDFLQYSPFPQQVDILQEIQKFIVFSYPIQAFAVYEKGHLIKWGPTNMGKKASQTPRGLFFTNWKGRKVRSTVDSEWILNWNFNIHNSEGVGFHQYAMPGYPASHSCIRLLDADAQWLYNWADQWVLADKNTIAAKGNPVLVYGDYNFGVKGIWYQLYKDPQITDISESQLTQLIQPHIETILREQNTRKAYFESKNQNNESVTTQAVDTL